MNGIKLTPRQLRLLRQFIAHDCSGARHERLGDGPSLADAGFMASRTFRVHAQAYARRHARQKPAHGEG
jgi:hypothetical protein